jgi:hypothetical protein
LLFQNRGKASIWRGAIWSGRTSVFHLFVPRNSENCMRTLIKCHNKSLILCNDRMSSITVLEVKGDSLTRRSIKGSSEEFERGARVFKDWKIQGAPNPSKKTAKKKKNYGKQKLGNP